MKKFFQSKGFIVSSLALLCVTILGVCWVVSRDRTGDFRPDESPPSSVTGDWSDGGTQTDGDNGADAYAPGQSTDAEEEYHKVTSQTEDKIKKTSSYFTYTPFLLLYKAYTVECAGLSTVLLEFCVVVACQLHPLGDSRITVAEHPHIELHVTVKDVLNPSILNIEIQADVGNLVILR